VGITVRALKTARKMSMTLRKDSTSSRIAMTKAPENGQTTG